MNVQRLRPRRGVTLAEIMVAVSVSALGIVGGLSLLSSQWNLIWVAQEQLYVSRILESRMEELRDLTFDQLDALDDDFTFDVFPATTVYGRDVNPSLSGPSQEPFERDLRDVTGRVGIETTDTNLRRITIEITWTPALSDEPISAVTATYVTRNGLSGH